MTAEQIAANRKSAIQLVRISLNLDSRAPSDWTYEERIGYNKALADYIASHPQDFSAQDLATAQDVQGSSYSALEDESFSWGDFGSAVTDNVVAAGEDVASIGQGVLSAASAMKYLIPAVVIGGGLYLAWRYVNAVPVPAARKASK